MQYSAPSPDNIARQCVEAIALKRLMRARYNGSEMLLAPHRLFTRHGELFVSAVNTRKGWPNGVAPRLGHFKLDGLSNVVLTEDGFEPLPTYDGSALREEDKEIFSVIAA